MVRYKLRTLLILLALTPPVIAWIMTPSTAWRVPIGDGKMVTFKTWRFGTLSSRLSGGFGHCLAQFDNLEFRVDANEVSCRGGRTVALPSSWSAVEVVVFRDDFKVSVDGTPLK